MTASKPEKKISRYVAGKKVRQLKELHRRDLELMRYLAWGPSNIPSIARRFFPSREQGRADGSDREILKEPSASKYVFDRLKQLQAAGYIQMKSHAGIGETVVMLQRAGAVEIAMRYGIEIENIRHVFPKTEEVMHDIMVASCIRAILDESETKGLYSVEYVQTEYLTRRIAGGGKRRRGVYFPDFRVRIAPHRGQPVTFDVEIDTGTTGRSQVFAKIASFKNPVIIVTKVTERIKYLFQVLQQDSARRQEKLPPIFFVLWSTLVREGLRHSDVIQFPSGNRGILPVALK